MSEKLFSGLAGEFYVGYRLAKLGYHVALTRGNAPNVDVLVSSRDGKKLLGIQVKAMRRAWSARKGTPERSHWEWPVKPARKWGPEPELFAFVDLHEEKVFIVPARDVRDAIEGIENERPFFWILERDKEKYLENWDAITRRVGKPS